MFILVSVLVFIVAILLVLVVLVQNPKGGLASNFSSSNQVMGVRKTTDFLEKATWSLGIALLVLSIISSSLVGGTNAKVTTNDSELIDQANQVVIPQSQAPMIQDGVPTQTQPQGANPSANEKPKESADKEKK